MKNTPFDSQWLDFYTILDVPVGADEDTIRKRIGKVYADAAAQSDHRDLSKRMYFQSLVERVLPQCRRVLLDPQWREKYDRQHILHSMNDPSAQDYVAFIASMRGGDLAGTPENQLPTRLQEEIAAARGVIETAQAGAELDLLPTTAISVRAEKQPAPENVASPKAEAQKAAPKAEVNKATSEKATPAKVAASSAETSTPVVQAPKFEAKPVEKTSQTIHQKGEPVRAQVLTAQEAELLKGRRASNPDAHVPVQIVSDLRGQKKAKSRVIVEEIETGPKRLISSTSLNLMVAITGVLLTITIQRFAETPAVATSQTRFPLYVAVAPEMAPSLQRLERGFETSREGENFDLIVQPLDGVAALNRAWGKGSSVPDAWIPTHSLWLERYNAGAKQNGRALLDSGTSLAQTPLVLVARADKSATLKQQFPSRQIPSWSALKSAIAVGAPGHFGLSAPQTTVSGTLARASMAREWGAAQGLGAAQAANSPAFWRWMAGFEDQIPSQTNSQTALLKDLVLGTTGRFWWAVAFESEAVEWMKQGQKLEIWRLPRTNLADHPIVSIERVGAPVEIARGRASLVNYLRSEPAQQAFLRDGFRPTEISPSTQIEGNPFRSPAMQKSGAKLQSLPRDERINTKTLQGVEKGWMERFG